MKQGLLIFSMLLFSTVASAETMSCIYGVYKASDLEDVNQSPDMTNRMIRMSLTENGGEAEAKINGETLAVELNKRPHADVYDLLVVLMTPVEDRPPKGASYVSAFGDFIVNDGPAKDNGWTVDYQPGAETFSFMQRQSGTFAITPKLRKAMESSGHWGKHPFTTSVLDPMYTSQLVDVIHELVETKKLKPTDVVGFGITFSCTRNK